MTGDKSFEYYNIKSDMWYRGPSMIESRSYHSSCSIGEYLYVIGGQDKCLIENVSIKAIIIILKDSLSQEILGNFPRNLAVD